MDCLLRLVWPLPGLLIAAWYFPPVATALVYAAALLVPFSASVLVHEGAHALVARLSGFQVTIFEVFPVSARIVDGRWHVRTSSLVGPSGLVGIAPTALDSDTFARRFRRTILAGPLASLAMLPLGAAALWWGLMPIFSQLGNAEGIEDALTLRLNQAEMATLILGVSLLAAAAAGTSTLIPGHADEISSDGMKLRLLSDPCSARVMQKAIRSTNLQLGVRRPREWPVDDQRYLEEIVRTAPDTPFELEHQLHAVLLLTAVYIDHRRPDRALALTCSAVGPSLGVGPVTHPYLQTIIALNAYLWVTHEADARTAKGSLSRIPVQAPIRRTSVFRSVDAALLASSGRHDEARRCARKAERLAKGDMRRHSTAVVELDMARAVLASLDSAPHRLHA